MTIINKILAVIALLLCAVIITGTVVVFAVQKGGFHSAFRKNDPSPQSSRFTAMNSFNELGQIRAVTRKEPAHEDGVTVVLTPWLAFEKGNDSAFSEELAQKSRQIRSLIHGYFSQHTETELLNKGETAVKAELLELINDQLVMGKIAAVYFGEYMYLE